jgi:hypothetical protein
MRRLVRRMRVPCAETEWGVPPGAICQRQLILSTYLLYMLDWKGRRGGEEGLLVDLRSVADGLGDGVG